MSPGDLAKGDVVRTWHDTGRSMTLLWGVVTRTGRRTFGVLWESGARTVSLQYDDPKGVERELNRGVAAEAMATMRARKLLPAAEKLVEEA